MTVIQENCFEMDRLDLLFWPSVLLPNISSWTFFMWPHILMNPSKKQARYMSKKIYSNVWQNIHVDSMQIFFKLGQS
jgi:hypothetical protein